MPQLLKIGFDYFIVRDAKAAAAAINALAGCIALRRDYSDTEKDFFYPDERQPDIGMLTVRADQILKCKPGEASVEVVSERKMLGDGQRRHSA